MDELSERCLSASATVVKGVWASLNGDSTSISMTDSPACQPEPEIFTVVPGGQSATSVLAVAKP
ncbi:MAG: hypothetical protein DMG22_06735 [Acidobacteria bacterium]|nr:MAG: hypothetical protein DMG22_06735 [Acidobacteriota bacterium]